MCRLFGFKSIIKSGLHTSLTNGENALMTQSPKHPDGWGVAYYINQAPHIIKSKSSAIEDDIFKKLAKMLTAQAVIAHLRKKTIGEHSIFNTHPFQYGQWTFAHNGNIKNFDTHKLALIQLIPSDLTDNIFGTTDSEIIFFIILGQLIKTNALISPHKQDVMDACQKAVKLITDIIGPLHPNDKGSPQENYLTFLISDGNVMLAHHGGKDLYYSTYKNVCREKNTCEFFSDICIKPTKTGAINHLIISSEPLSGENVWIKMKLNEIICLDENMNIFK